MPTHIYENPVKYSNNNSLQYNFAMDVLSKAQIKVNDRVLDLGCGDGRVTSHIAKIASNGCVIGTDISVKMIEHANQTHLSQDNLRFMQMDMSRNVFKSQFDVITSFNSLHWVNDQENALKGIEAAAAPNAKIILLLSHKESNYHFTLDNLCSSTKWGSFFRGYSNPRSFFERDQYHSFLQEAGLHVESLVEKGMTSEFNSIDQEKAFLNSSMANIKQIPENLKDDFLEDFCIEFFRLSGCKSSNRIPISFWCLEIHATKLALDKENILSKDNNAGIQRRLKL